MAKGSSKPVKLDERQEPFVRQPNRQIRLKTSKDGRYFIAEIIETWFFPTRYVATIAANAGKPRPMPDTAQADGEAQTVEE